MDTTACTHCNTEISPGGRFCPECGKGVPGSEEAGDETESTAETTPDTDMATGGKQGGGSAPKEGSPKFRKFNGKLLASIFLWIVIAAIVVIVFLRTRHMDIYVVGYAITDKNT